MESGDYVSLCELAKKYDMPDLAARCEILACRHVSASDETACELLQYAEYLQLRTLWKASASHLLRSRFRGQQSGAGVASSYSESTQVTPVNDDTQLDVNITENKHDNVSSVTEPPADETPQQQQIQLSEDSAINEILKKFLETVPSNVYSLDIDILSRRK